jgi:uncharacterized protein (DUF433 family)
MTAPTDIKYIECDADVYGGKPCVAGYRIAVHAIAIFHRQGLTPVHIAEQSGLAPVQIYAALTYYYDPQDVIDREIAEEDGEIAARARRPVAARPADTTGGERPTLRALGCLTRYVSTSMSISRPAHCDWR